MKEQLSLGRVAVCGAVCLMCWAAPVAAQPAATAGAAVGAIESPSSETELLIRQLLLRLETQEALNTALLKRVLALEAPQSSLTETLNHAGPTASATTVESTPTAEQLESEIQSVDRRIDLLPKLAGYYDFEYFDDDRAESPGEFRQHHLSMHISKEVDRFRVFNELEFEYGSLFKGTGNGAGDARGELKLEQSWGEYTLSDLFTVRGGLILSPQYWNVNHYPNIVVSTSRPMMVRQVFPESFVGIMGYGVKHWGNVGVRYSGYVGNGDSAFSPKEDTNDSKSVGGLLAVELPVAGLFDSVSVGLSGYSDQPVAGKRTRTWGFESTAQKGPFHLLLEFATRKAEEERRGLYVQPSYRLNDHLAAFYRYDFLRGNGGPTRANIWGVNYRPVAPVSVKIEYLRHRPSRQKPYNALASSLAILF